MGKFLKANCSTDIGGARHGKGQWASFDLPEPIEGIWNLEALIIIKRD
jgi:hypothetical protein